MAGSWDKFWRGIDAKNLSTKHRDMLMNDVYGGYKTRTVKVSGRRYKWGTSKGTTKEVPFYDYYNGGGWDAIKGAVGIKNVNSRDEIRRLYDYVSGYRPPAPAPAPKAAPKPAPKPVSNPYRDQSAALMKTIDSLVKTIDKPAPAPPPPPKTIFAGSSNVSGPGNLQIAPAAGVNKRSGTNNFKRRTQSAPTNKLRTIQSVNV